MAYYDYQCCKCGHVQEERHGMTETPIITCQKCKKYTCRKMIGSNITQGSGNATEIADYGDIRKYKPEYLRFKDGHREKFDPTKHGHKKGSGR